VLEVMAGPERGSLCLDDAADDCDADCDATPMSPTSFLSAQSSTPSKLDDNAETERQWAAFSAHYKSKPPQPHATHFAAWKPVGELGVAPQRNDFAGASPGTFRGRHLPTTTMESFQIFFTTDMCNRIIECTNDRVQRMLDGRIPRPNHLRRGDKWPPQWARSWTPLNYGSLCLWIACCVARSIVGVLSVKETFAWSTAPFVAIPGISTIMSRATTAIPLRDYLLTLGVWGGGLFIERTSPLASRKPSTWKPARLAII
jgi:hypothetical protein